MSNKKLAVKHEIIILVVLVSVLAGIAMIGYMVFQGRSRMQRNETREKRGLLEDREDWPQIYRELDDRVAKVDAETSVQVVNGLTAKSSDCHVVICKVTGGLDAWQAVIESCGLEEVEQSVAFSWGHMTTALVDRGDMHWWPMFGDLHKSVFYANQEFVDGEDDGVRLQAACVNDQVMFIHCRLPR